VATIKSSPLVKLFLGGGPAFGEISGELTLSLYELFRPGVEELAGILDRDLSAWKSGARIRGHQRAFHGGVGVGSRTGTAGDARHGQCREAEDRLA